MNNILVFCVLGLVVFVLSIYLGFLWTKLKEQTRKLEEVEKKAQANFDSVKESVVLISKATLQKQCESSEACIRIYNLLSKIGLINDYPVTKKFYADISSLAILDKRQALSNQEAFDQDKVRFKAENKYDVDFRSELEEILRSLS